MEDHKTVRNVAFGVGLQNRVRPMGVEEVLTAECLDHVIIFNETRLRISLHHRSRTHLSLNKDCPDARRIQPPSVGEIVVPRSVERRAA